MRICFASKMIVKEFKLLDYRWKLQIFQIFYGFSSLKMIWPNKKELQHWKIEKLKFPDFSMASLQVWNEMRAVLNYLLPDASCENKS